MSYSRTAQVTLPFAGRSRTKEEWLHRRMQQLHQRFDSPSLPVQGVYLTMTPDEAEKIVPAGRGEYSYDWDSYGVTLEEPRGRLVSRVELNPNDTVLGWCPPDAPKDGPRLILESRWSHVWRDDMAMDAGMTQTFYLKLSPIDVGPGVEEVYKQLLRDGWDAKEALDAAVKLGG